MKILHVIPSVAPVRGGPSLAALDMVKALLSQGITAEIATTNDNGVNLLDISLQKCIEYQQVPVWFFPRFSPNINFIREYAFSYELTKWLWQNISNYDLVHIHALFSYASTAAMTIARLKKIPYIVQPHGLLCKWSLEQHTYKKKIYFQLIEKANLNYSQALHLTSESEQQDFYLLGLDTESFVLPLGISPAKPIPYARERLRQKFKIPENEVVILFLSRLHPKKGLDYLIPALNKLSQYRFTFIIAGNGTPEYEEEIKSLILSNHIYNNTYLVGFVQEEFKDILIQGSDLFVLTSHSENFGIVILEALAAGLPLLLTPGVALSSIVKEHQVGYITKLDVSAIASTLEKFLSNPEAIKEMSQRARELVSDKYSWEHISTKLQKIYADIIQQNKITNKR
jgi:glycosyltransferase involved in cell wall biosynthesis